LLVGLLLEAGALRYGWSKMEGSSGCLYGRHKDTQRLISK
jgi:hypothetical protein